MRIQIDTSAKTIRIEESVKLPELFSMIKKLLPNDEWKNYSLESAVINNWWNPIYIDRYVPIIPLVNPNPLIPPFYTTCEVNVGNGNAATSVPGSTYCIEMN